MWGARTYIMGVINVTPDSFSGDGFAYDVDAAVEQGIGMVAAGADILDVGGESTRPSAADPTQPGYMPVTIEEELRRVLPVIERLSQTVDVPISIDTYKAETARQALRAGAHMINDVWGFRRDPEMASVAAEFGVPAVVMHNQRGRTCNDVIRCIHEGWQESFAIADAAGLPRERLIVDPGFGFGWTVEQNLAMLRRLGELQALNRPILIGTSRKTTIGLVLGGLPVEERLEGTAATIAIAIANGADIVRVHDVLPMARVARMADAIVREMWKGGGG